MTRPPPPRPARPRRLRKKKTTRLKEADRTCCTGLSCKTSALNSPRAVYTVMACVLPLVTSVRGLFEGGRLIGIGRHHRCGIKNSLEDGGCEHPRIARRRRSRREGCGDLLLRAMRSGTRVAAKKSNLLRALSTL